MTQEQMVKLRSEVNELLDMIKIKLVNVPDITLDADEDSWGSKNLAYKNEKTGEIYSAEHRALVAVKDIVEELKGDRKAVTVLEQYYDSNC